MYLYVLCLNDNLLFTDIILFKPMYLLLIFDSTRLISIESQPKKIVVMVVVVIGVGVVVVHVVAVVIPVVDTRNIPNKVWLKSGY